MNEANYILETQNQINISLYNSVKDLTRINDILTQEISKIKKSVKKSNRLNTISILALGYSVYVQASKIENLNKKIEEIKPTKGA